MKPDEFEQKLSAQPWQEVPPSWRREILHAARQASRAEKEPVAIKFWIVLSDWLWPSPKAWAGLAAAWIFIGLVNFSLPNGAAARKSVLANQSFVSVADWHAHRRLTDELLNLTEPSAPVAHNAAAPAPRSEQIHPTQAG